MRSFFVRIIILNWIFRKWNHFPAGVVQHSSQLCYCSSFSRWRPHAGSNAAHHKSWVCYTHTHTRWITLLKCTLYLLFYFQSLSNSEMVPSDVQGELKHLYVAAGELLRHFWSCFPVNTPFLEEKVSNFHTIGSVVVSVYNNLGFFVSLRWLRWNQTLRNFRWPRFFLSRRRFSVST